MREQPAGGRLCHCLDFFARRPSRYERYQGVGDRHPPPLRREADSHEALAGAGATLGRCSLLGAWCAFSGKHAATITDLEKLSPSVVCPEGLAGESSPPDGIFVLFGSLLRHSPIVVKLDHVPCLPRKIYDDEAQARLRSLACHSTLGTTRRFGSDDFDC